MFKKSFFVVCFIVVLVSIAKANFQKISQKECQELIIEGVKAYENNQYADALKKLTKAELAIQNTYCESRLWYVQNLIGNVYKISTNYAEALSHYLKALETTRASAEPNENTATVLANIGVLYYQTNEKAKSLMYYEESYKLSNKINSDYNKVFSALNIADIYNKKGELDIALQYLQEIKSIPKSAFFERIWKVNYADNLFYREKTAEAQKIAEELLAENQEKDVCYICVLELLSKIYASKGQLDKAIEYTQQELQYTEEWKPKIEKYNRLAELYKKKEIYTKSLEYKDSAMLAKDSLASRINKQLFAVNKVKLEVQKYENDLKINQQKRKSERKIFIIIIVFIIVIAGALFFIIYRDFRNRIIKQRQQRTIMEGKQKIISLELEKEKNEHQALKDQALLRQERLRNKIEQKNRKLSAKALYLSDRDKLIEGIINSLTQVPEISGNKNVAQNIKSLKDHLKADAEWDEFIEHFEKVNPNFLRVLKEEHPKLTANDIRFLCYIYMNLDVKEISSIFNITTDASRKRKQRIAKKMGVNIDDLHDYILKIS